MSDMSAAAAAAGSAEHCGLSEGRWLPEPAAAAAAAEAAGAPKGLQLQLSMHAPAREEVWKSLDKSECK